MRKREREGERARERERGREGERKRESDIKHTNNLDCCHHLFNQVILSLPYTHIAGKIRQKITFSGLANVLADLLPIF